MNIKTITLNISISIKLVYNDMNHWVLEDSGSGIWMTLRFNPNQDRYPKLLDLFAGHSTPLSMTVGALDHFTPLNTEHNRESKCYILNDVIYLTLHQLTFTGVVGVNWVSTFLQTVRSKRLRKYDRGRKSSTVPVHFLVRDQLANGAGTGTKFGQLQIHRKESQL